MIVDSNAASPLKYTDPTFQSSLFVRANIYDTSGVSPTLENTVNLTQINNGTYWGKYTYTAGKTYLVQKLVYTDGTYTTVDQTYAQDNDDVQCINLHTANLDAAISTRNSTAHFDTVIGAPAGANIAADLAEIEAETDGIAAIPTNPLLTNDARLNDLDAPISSRLASSDSRLNHLDADISSRLASGSYSAPDNVDIALIKVVTDKFLFDGSNFVKANAQVVADKTGYDLLTATVNTITAQVWDQLLSAHVTAGTFGLNAQAAALTPTAVAAAVWDALLAAHTTANTFGAIVQAAGLTPTAVAQAVWNAVANLYNTPGTMGALENASGGSSGGGDDIVAFVDAAQDITTVLDDASDFIGFVDMDND